MARQSRETDTPLEWGSRMHRIAEEHWLQNLGKRRAIDDIGASLTIGTILQVCVSNLTCFLRYAKSLMHAVSASRMPRCCRS